MVKAYFISKKLLGSLDFHSVPCCFHRVIQAPGFPVCHYILGASYQTLSFALKSHSSDFLILASNTAKKQILGGITKHFTP